MSPTTTETSRRTLEPSGWDVAPSTKPTATTVDPSLEHPSVVEAILVVASMLALVAIRIVRF